MFTDLLWDLVVSFFGWGLKITPGNRENSIISVLESVYRFALGSLAGGKFIMLDWGLKITPGNRENSIIISIRECLQICSGIIGWW